MKMTVQQNSLSETLKQIERLSVTYKKDMESYSFLTIADFFLFMSRKINYISDPVNAELVMRPAILLHRGGGDCDDKTVACLAWFMNKNISCGYALVSERPDREFHHIFPVFIDKGKTTDFDCTYNNAVFPNKYKHYTRRQDKIIFKGRQ